MFSAFFCLSSILETILSSFLTIFLQLEVEKELSRLHCSLEETTTSNMELEDQIRLIKRKLRDMHKAGPGMNSKAIARQSVFHSKPGEGGDMKLNLGNFEQTWDEDDDDASGGLLPKLPFDVSDDEIGDQMSDASSTGDAKQDRSVFARWRRQESEWKKNSVDRSIDTPPHSLNKVASKDPSVFEDDSPESNSEAEFGEDESPPGVVRSPSTDGSDDSEGSVRSQDYRSLDSAIDTDDLHVVESRAARLASKVKSKLNESTMSSSYPLPIVQEENGQRSADPSFMGDLDLSRISKDESHTIDQIEDNTGYALPALLHTGSAHSGTESSDEVMASAGESSGMAETPSRDSSTDSDDSFPTTQRAGQPSQGEVREPDLDPTPSPPAHQIDFDTNGDPKLAKIAKFRNRLGSAQKQRSATNASTDTTLMSSRSADENEKVARFQDKHTQQALENDAMNASFSESSNTDGADLSSSALFPLLSPKSQVKQGKIAKFRNRLGASNDRSKYSEAAKLHLGLDDDDDDAEVAAATGPSKPEPVVPKAAAPKNLPSPKPIKSVPVETSFSIGDWSAVGVTASILDAWSDSMSTSSRASESTYQSSSVTGSSSIDATRQASELETPLANEIDKLIGNMDWEGVKRAPDSFVDPQSDDPLASYEMDGTKARRKKREIESAWKASLSKSILN